MKSEIIWQLYHQDMNNPLINDCIKSDYDYGHDTDKQTISSQKYLNSDDISSQIRLSEKSSL